MNSSANRHTAGSWRRLSGGARLAVASLAVVALLAVAGGLYVRARMAEPSELRTVTIERRDLLITLDTTGTVEPMEVVEVGPLVSGKIVQFGRDRDHGEGTIDVGSRLARGDLLVQLDSQLYEVELQKAQAALRLAAAEVDRLQAQLQQAERILERARRLRDTNSQSEFDRILTEYDTARAELAIGRARFEQAEAEARQAQINLTRTSIRAPIDGVVIDRRANLGQTVSAASAGLFLLAQDLDQMRLRASVSETDIGKVTVGQPVSFSVDAHRDVTMTGRVEKILLNARMQGNFVSYDVLVAIDKPPVNLLPHMTADVKFETLRRQQAWLVPTGALRWWPDEQQIVAGAPGVKRPAATRPDAEPTAGDHAYVWVPSDNGKVRPLPVQVGVDDGVYTEVSGGPFRTGMPVVVGTVKQTTLARIVPSAKTLR